MRMGALMLLTNAMLRCGSHRNTRRTRTSSCFCATNNPGMTTGARASFPTVEPTDKMARPSAASPFFAASGLVFSGSQTSYQLFVSR